MKFLAEMTKTRVPTIGISSVAEKIIFTNSVSHYVSNSRLDVEKMSADWNLGNLFFR